MRDAVQCKLLRRYLERSSNRRREAPLSNPNPIKIPSVIKTGRLPMAMCKSRPLGRCHSSLQVAQASLGVAQCGTCFLTAIAKKSLAINNPPQMQARRRLLTKREKNRELVCEQHGRFMNHVFYVQITLNHACRRSFYNKRPPHIPCWRAARDSYVHTAMNSPADRRSIPSSPSCPELKSQKALA